jgi:hypothetical protein
VTTEAQFAWADRAIEATVAVVKDGPATAHELLSRLGPVEAHGPMSFIESLDLQGTLYDAGMFDRRAVFQVEALPGTDGEWWAAIEPNRFRASDAQTLKALAAGRAAASFFWNVNAVLRLIRVDCGAVIVPFDPLLELDLVPEEGRDLRFAESPRSSAMTLLERWTGGTITKGWFSAAKPTLSWKPGSPHCCVDRDAEAPRGSPAA